MGGAVLGGGGPGASLLLTDLYQLAMMQAYLERGMTAPAAFELFFRTLPPRRGFLLAAGLAQALEFLEGAAFAAAELDWLKRSGRFGADLIAHLETWRFTGAVEAVPEGTAVFADEPVIRVVAPLPAAQLVETRIMNLIHFQTVVASKAARMVLAAPGKVLVDFGLRRAHGAEAGLLAARASYLAGFAGTATTLAGALYDIPVYGTMAHSFIQAHDDERQAMLDFARARPRDLVLLIDTYDTEAAARMVVEIAQTLKAEGIRIAAVRLDSGDLGAHARAVRAILDDGGLADVGVFASGGLDEDSVAALVQGGAPIAGFGIGTSLTTSSDVPALDCAYKLQEYDGVPRRKWSEGKATWPGRKQIWRRFAADGAMAGDTLGLVGEDGSGAPLLEPVMRDGRRLGPGPTLAESRARAAETLRRLPPAQRALTPGAAYPVTVSAKLRALADDVDRRMRAAVARPAVDPAPRWEHFPHDADIGVRGIGPTPVAAFEQAAVALTALVTDPAGIAGAQPVALRCAAPNLEILFVDWLNAVIFEMTTRRVVFGRFAVAIDGETLTATAWGEPVDRPRHAPAVEPKGATYTCLSVARGDDGMWRAQAVVDV